MRPLPLMSATALTLAIILAFASPCVAWAQAADPIGAIKDHAAGVTGSAEAMVLHVRGLDGGDRVLSLGQIYEDGWVLSALSASTASFTRRGVTRQIGLTPSGTVAAAAAPVAPSVVIVPGGLNDIVERFSTVGVDLDRPGTGGGVRLGPGEPMIKMGEVLSDGWKLVGLTGSTAIFERNGEYRAMGKDAQGRATVGRPDQPIPPRDGLLALTPLDMPADLLRMPTDQRLAFYRQAEATILAEARARYGKYPGDWDIQAALGLERYMDRRTLLDAEARQNPSAGRVVLVKPTIDAATGQRVMLLESTNPATGEVSRVLSTGTSDIREALGLLNAQTSVRP